MDIDLQALRALERERDVSLDVLIPAIESAVLQAYLRTDDHYPNARAELDRKSGHVVIWAREAYEVTEEVPVIADPDAEGDEDEAAELGTRTRVRRELGPEFDHTPSGFGKDRSVNGSPGDRPADARARGRGDPGRLPRQGG